MLFIYLVSLSLGLSNAYSSLKYFGLHFIFSNVFSFVEGSDNSNKHLHIISQDLDDITKSVEMAEKVRVLCWVLTYPENHQEKAIHVKKTWGHRCNKLLFMSTEYDETLPTVKLPVKEGRNYLWGKSKATFRYIYENHRTEADWFFQADDDTYTIMENMRYMLYGYNSRELLYFGPITEKGFVNGGAGYVISRSTLDLLYSHGLNGKKTCIQHDKGSADVNIGTCLHKLGIKAMDTRDYKSRGRFFPFSLMEHLFSSKNTTFWYSDYVYYNTADGINCCSDYAITFHHITPREMYLYDYFVYRLRPYGIHFYMEEPPDIMIVNNDSSTSTSRFNLQLLHDQDLIKTKQSQNFIDNFTLNWISN